MAAHKAPLSLGSSRQEYWSGLPFPCPIEWSRAKANRSLPRKHTGHSKHPLPTTQKTLHMDITRWSKPKPDWLYSLQPKMEKLYTLSKNKTRSWLWLRSWTPYCQIQTLKLKKVGKANKGPSSQSYGFSSSHIWMWELDHKDSWAWKNGCFSTVVLKKTFEGPLDCKETKPVHPKRNQSWIFIVRTDAEAETPNTLATWCEELIHLKRPWCWERLKAGGEGDSRGWDGWMASLTQWTWVWVSSESWWWTGKPGMLQFTGSQDLDKAYQLNDIYHLRNLVLFFSI